MLTSCPTQVKAPGFRGNHKPWSVSRSSGVQLSTSRPQQTPDSVPVGYRLRRTDRSAAPVSTCFWLTLSLANHHRIMFCASARPCVARSGSALTPPLQLTYHGSFFTGFKDNPSSPLEQPHSSFPKGSALDGRPCPQSPSLGRGRPLALGPRAPLKGQATNPSRHFRSSSQSHSTLTRTPVSRRPP